MKINYEWRQCWWFFKEKLITNHTLSVFEFENNYESLKSSKSSMIELRKWKFLKILKIEILFFYVELMMEMVIWSLNSVPIMRFPWKLWSKNLYFRKFIIKLFVKLEISSISISILRLELNDWLYYHILSIAHRQRLMIIDVDKSHSNHDFHWCLWC